ncbi:hypothetical protein M407DRAFT_226107 [Tulasnella calospora MUT 4182]|uniref:Uncharacterized protein n=1 Tax=Tulasnella calospora MUT 4182 TaxID=1051891 RepID=A0A0C3QP28_9AGAM|nr:hypothetical protein M407DRAFT_226107 [Tulasnella calospora MUT 4182]
MDSSPDHYHWPRVGLCRIPDDVILYILDCLQSSALGAMTLANRHLQELATPALYRNITIPQKEDKHIEHEESAARLLRTLSRRPSLAVLVRSLENAPPVIPLELRSRIDSEHMDPSDPQTEYFPTSAWNRFVGRILDAQLSLEHLDYPFDNKRPVFVKEMMEKWAPKLRVLGGSQVGGFKAFLSNKHSIETLVLKSANTIKELVYQGQEKDSIDFGELFATVPWLSSFRGETWLSVPLEDFFRKDLPWAFTSAPYLEEFDLHVHYRPPTHVLSIFQPKAPELDLPSRDQEWPRDQTALLKRYSTVCPELRVFTFPDGRRWARIEDKWMYQDQFARDVVGLC